MSTKSETPEMVLARQAMRKSRVRVVVTYLAAIFVFVGGICIIIGLALGWVKSDQYDSIKEVFMTVLPIATGILTYWFADRAANKDRTENGGEKPETAPSAEKPEQTSE